MANRRCRPQPIFEGGATEEFGTMMERVIGAAEQNANASLTAYRNAYGDAEPGGDDLSRLLREAVRAATREALDPRILASLARKLGGEIPCTSPGLRRRFTRAHMRKLEDEIGLLALYGFKHGLTARDARLLPVRTVTVGFSFEDGLEGARIESVSFDLDPRHEARYFRPVSTIGEFRRSGMGLRRIEAKDVQWYEKIPLVEIIECLADIVARLIDALTSSDEEKLDEAIDDAEDALEELEEDIRDLKEEIDELEEEIDDEDDSEDREELEAELEELEEEKKGAEAARDHLKRALKELKRAKSSLD
ncbi:MAG TPA: hypothetical protein VF212_02870 [Longimicrobiales bacterium]